MSGDALDDAVAFRGRLSDEYKNAMPTENNGKPRTRRLVTPAVVRDVPLLGPVSMPQLRQAVDLGLALLVAEAEDHAYEPVAVVATLREALELSVDDLAHRMARLETGDEPLCPVQYVLWMRAADGRYRLSYRITSER